MSTQGWKEAAEKYAPTQGCRKTEQEPVSEYQYQKQRQIAFQAGAEHACEQLKQRLEDAEKIIDADNLALKEVEEKVEEKAAEIMKLESECDQLRARIKDAEKALKFYAKGNGGRACAEDYFAKNAGGEK